MVAFIVKVKLVENKVKRKVGIVMVENVISQYRTPGRAKIKKTIALPNIPSQDFDPPPVCAEAVSKARPAATELFRPEARSETEDIFSEAVVMRLCEAAELCMADLTAQWRSSSRSLFCYSKFHFTAT